MVATLNEDLSTCAREQESPLAAACFAGALERGEFEAHFQPVVELASGEIVGCEALARWRRRSGVLLAAAHFVGGVERSAVAAEFGATILRQAVTAAAGWAATRDRRARWVSVNLSPAELLLDDLPERVAVALAEGGLAPERLRLEVSEEARLDDCGPTGRALRHLAELGVGLVLDDFGVGYARCAPLGRLPLAALKLDGRFLAHEAMARHVLGLGRSLGLEVVAEGVERASQVAHLRAWGFGLAQGFHFAPALSGAAVTALFEEGEPGGAAA